MKDDYCQGCDKRCFFTGQDICAKVEHMIDKEYEDMDGYRIPDKEYKPKGFPDTWEGQKANRKNK